MKRFFSRPRGRFLVGLAVLAAVAAAGPVVARATAARTSSTAPILSVTGPAVQRGTLFPPLPRFCDPVPGASGGEPRPAANFAGLSSSDGQFHPLPADTSGSAGRFAFGEVINEAVGFFAKATGRPLCPAQPVQQMWAGTTCAANTTDAVLRYDSLANRWVVARPGARSYCVAISQGEDPTAGWFRYQFPVSVPGAANGAGDFPKLSVWSDGYTYSSRIRIASAPEEDASFLGDYTIAFQRQAMLSGKPASAVEFVVPQSPAPSEQFYFLPVSAEGSAVSPGGSLAPFIEQAMGSSDQLQVWNLQVNWRQPGTATFRHAQDLTVLPYDTRPPAITQPPIGTSAAPTLAPGGRVSQPLSWRRIGGRGAIFGAMATAVQFADGQRAGIRWFELRQAGDQWTVAQQGTYAPDDGNSRWLPSLTANARGDVGLLFSVSGPALAPSLHYTTHLAGDPPGSMRPERRLVDGSGTQGQPACARTTDCPFGDYNQMSLDPARNCVFWMAGEYYPDQDRADTGDFATRVGSFELPRCG